MRAIVTGGCGFIASHLVDRLLELGDMVTVVDNLTRQDPIMPPNSVSFVQASATALPFGITDRYLSNTDIIYHLGSPCGVRKLTCDVAWDIIDSSDGVLRLAKATNARVVAFSTSEVIGRGGVHDESATISVNPDYDTRSQYQVGKLAMECMLLTDGIKCQIVRPFNVAGPRQSAAGGFVLARFIEAVKRGDPLPLFAPGTQQREFLWVGDVVDFCVMLRDEKRWPVANNIWHLGNPANRISISDLADRVIESWYALTGTGGCKQYVDPSVSLGVPYRDAPEKFADIAAVLEFGWEPKIPLEVIIRQCLTT